MAGPDSGVTDDDLASLGFDWREAINSTTRVSDLLRRTLQQIEAMEATGNFEALEGIVAYRMKAKGAGEMPVIAISGGGSFAFIALAAFTEEMVAKALRRDWFAALGGA